MPPNLLEEVKVELKLEVKVPLKVSLIFIYIYIYIMFWGYSNFDFGWIMILSSLSVRGDGLFERLKFVPFFAGLRQKKEKNCVNFLW